MAQTRPLTLTLLAFAAPLALAACTDNGPWPLPTGYTYYTGKYHAPLGPEPTIDHKEQPYHAGASSTTTTQTSTTTSTTTTGMDSGAALPTGDTQAANDLSARLFADFGKPTSDVWIRPAHGAMRDPTFENALHSALESQGIHVTDVQGGGPYAIAYRIDGSTVKLTLVTGGRKAAEASGTYNLDNGGGASPSVETAPVSAIMPDATSGNFTVTPPTPTEPPAITTTTPVAPETAVPPGAASADVTSGTTTYAAPGAVSSPPTDIAPVTSTGAGDAPPPPDMPAASSPSVTTDTSALQAPSSSSATSSGGATAPASRGSQTYHVND